jgi:hypothetical protein
MDAEYQREEPIRKPLAALALAAGLFGFRIGSRAPILLLEASTTKRNFYH